MDDYIKLDAKEQVHRSISFLVDILNHYFKENRLLHNFIRERGYSQVEVANAIGVTRQAISLKWGKEKKK